MILQRPEMKPHFSPSQIKTARDCPRKWHGESVCGWKQPETDAQAFGKRVHTVLQAYLEGELDHELSVRVAEEACLLPALKYFPNPLTPHLLCEQEVYIDEAEFNTGKKLYGFFDVVVLVGYDADTQQEVLWVYDLKTTSNLAYMKSEDELRADAQALVYGWAGLQLAEQTLGFRHKQVRFCHVYARTKGGAGGAFSDVLLTEEEIRAGLETLAVYCRQMLEWESLPFAAVPTNLNACGKYGGCHLKPECAQTGLPVFGESHMRQAVAGLAITRLSEQPLEKEPMSKAFDEAMARRKAAGANAMSALMGNTPAAPATPAAAPAAAAAPVKPAEPDDLNPPDGDVHGESGLVSVPTDATVPEGEEDEAPVQATTSPDAGYVPQAAVLPPETDKPTGRKGRPPSPLTAAQRKVQELSEVPAHLARMQGIDNKLLAAILQGKTPKAPEAADVEEVLRILEALEQGKDLVVAKAPAAPAGDKPSDVLQQRLDAAKVAVVTAKDTLVKHTKQLRELEDAGDDDAADKFRTEVRVPAQRALKDAEAQVVDFEQRLQAALQQEKEAAEAQRLKDEAEIARKAVATAATQREQAVEAVAAPQAAPQIAQAAVPAFLGGNGNTVVIKGSVPTRALRNAPHIDEIVNPYRRKAEAQAMTAYYGTMKTDSYAQICALIVQDVQTGSLVLPALIIAPAMCSPLQDRVLEALSPYLYEFFYPLR